MNQNKRHFPIITITIIVISISVFSIKGYSLFSKFYQDARQQPPSQTVLDNEFNVLSVDHSQDYNCFQLDATWSKCVNQKYKFSFEYPTGWHHIDQIPYSEGIALGPINDIKLLNNWIIDVEPENNQTQKQALDQTDKYFKGFKSPYEVTKRSIEGRPTYIAVDQDYSTVDTIQIVNGKTDILIHTRFRSEEGPTVSQAEAIEVMNHFLDTFNFID